MKVLIVDDEPIARQILREHLEEIPGAVVAGEASDGLDAADKIVRLKPDVVLLDIQMPNLDGIALARSLRAGPPVIFTTAFSTHAVDAFHVGALDYLLKPVRRDRLEQALRKVTPVAVHEAPRKIVGKRGSDLHMLPPSDVVAFEAEGELVWIHAAQGKFEANQSLRALEERLPCPPFRRIHRKTIINTDHIRKISPLSSRRWMLTLSNGMQAIVSKRMAGVIRGETEW
ncbi:MAG: LytTR family DNA-binding domain-containing protein [Bryobacteraceae bacterium]